MRALTVVGIAASLLSASTIADATPPRGASVPVEHDLSGVPTLPLTLPPPPAPPPPILAADATPPASGWSSEGRWASRIAGAYPPAVYHLPAGATTVIVQGVPVVTTTTTTTYVEEDVVRRRVRSGCRCK